ncbi:hypothetical protein DSUL_20461 [Desulfovibrionales bacterium]
MLCSSWWSGQKKAIWIGVADAHDLGYLANFFKSGFVGNFVLYVPLMSYFFPLFLANRLPLFSKEIFSSVDFF